MATNNGTDGVLITHIAQEETRLIGVQTPNTYQPVRESRDRVKLPIVKITPTEGCVVKDSTMYDCEMVDTSWLSYGGKYTLGVGNRWNIRVGSGGIYNECRGPIQVQGSITIQNYTKGYFVQTNLFHAYAKERAMMMGKRLDIDFDETFIHGNTSFLQNVLINGGLYVNGEFMCNHMTTQKQVNVTEFNSDNQGFVNPSMSFHVFQGQSAAAFKYTTKSLMGTICEAIDITDSDEKIEYIDAEIAFNTDFLEQALPGLNDVGIDLFKTLFMIPIKIKFPKGISLISDATDTDHPEIYPLLQLTPRIIGEAIDSTDVFGPGHQHFFSGPACHYVEDTQAMYKKGANILADHALPHDPTVTNGSGSFDELKQQIETMAKNYLKEYLKKSANLFLPKSLQMGTDDAPTQI